MQKYLLLFCMLFIISCDDNGTDPGTTSNSYSKWYYITNHDSNYDPFVQRFDKTTGNIETLVDSARILTQAVNNKIAYLKLSYRISPDSGEVTDYNLFIADMDGSNPKQLLKEGVGFSPDAAFLTPDLKKIILINSEYTGEEDSYSTVKIVEIAADTYTSDKISYCNGSSFYLSPAGNKIAYTARGQGIMIYDLNTGNENLIYTGDIHSESDMAWTGDGQYVYTSVGIDDIYYFLKINVSTGQYDTIFQDYHVRFPGLYDNDKKIFFQYLNYISESELLFEVMTCNIDGSGLERINPDSITGYSIPYFNQFISDYEIVAMSRPSAEGSDSEDLVKMNLKTKEITMIRKGFAELIDN